MIPSAPVAARVDVFVNGVPAVLGAPVLRAGDRVLVPARSLLTALGAAVSYDAATRRITVVRGNRVVVVTIGSAEATIDGRTVALDAPARVVDSRTYLPLRFVAQSLGDDVSYDAAARRIAIAGSEGAAPPTVENRRPAPGELASGPYVAVSAAVVAHGGPPVDPSSLRMFLDGRDVTDVMARQGDLVGYTSPQPLAAGAHEVTVQGADDGGTRFTANWTFYSTFPYATVPAPYSYGGLYVTGATAAAVSGLVQVALVAPAGGYGFLTLCGYEQQYAFVYVPAYGRYVAQLQVPQNLFAPVCYVTGTFVDAGGARNYLALTSPISINTMPVSLSVKRKAGPHVARPRPLIVQPSARPEPRPTG